MEDITPTRHHTHVSDDDLFMDDIIFKSCMVQSQTPASFFTLATPHPVVESSISPSPPPASWIAYVTQPIDPSKPSLQPGAGIYTSPLTVHVPDLTSLGDVVHGIADVLRVLRMPNIFDAGKFKYNIAVYFTSGFARFSIRIWRHVNVSADDAYVVEVMRERGDRILVTRLFEFLSAVLKCCDDKDASAAVVAGYDRDFNVNMFDWAPRSLPPDVLAALPQPSAQAVASGIVTFVCMIGSMYDDVAVNGCASVAKLAAASSRTCDSMAGSPALVRILFQVLCGVAVDEDGHENKREYMSVDTRSNAAVALAEIVANSTGRDGVKNACDVLATSPLSLQTLGDLCMAAIDGIDAYACVCLQKDCVRILAAVTSMGAFQKESRRVAYFYTTLDDKAMYAPLVTAIGVLDSRCRE